LIQKEKYKIVHTYSFVVAEIESIISSICEIKKEDLLNENNKSQSDFALANQLLDISSQYGFLLTATNDSTRGIGKTTALINKAYDLDCTLIVGSHFMKKYVDEIARNMNKHIE